MTPRIELITTGTELLDTRLNQHVIYLGAALRSHGFQLARQTSVPDGPELESILRDAIHRADVVLVTGGLGPTTDDLTRETLASILGLPLHLDEKVAEHIRDYFKKRGRETPDFVFRQAMVPEGGQVLSNPSGTAPGISLLYGGVSIFLLPGPPRELHPMWENHVLPRIVETHPRQAKSGYRTLSVVGLGESDVQTRTQTCLQDCLPEELGYCAHPGIVDIRIQSANKDQEDQIIRRLTKEFKKECFTTTGESLPEAVIRAARERNILIATAESCTGGLAAQRLTRVPGASAVVDRAWVTYSNEAKRECLGVPGEIIESHGAVSAEVAEAMARGALVNSRAGIAISITGIAGPDGGTKDKPVGTVWFGLGQKQGDTISISTSRYTLPPDRITFQDIAANYALMQIREAIFS
jgi:nicotinamide-nucleotide amidase